MSGMFFRTQCTCLRYWVSDRKSANAERFRWQRYSAIL